MTDETDPKAKRKPAPKDPGLRQLTDGRFRYRIYVDGRKDGRREQVTLPAGTSKKDAEKAYAAAVARAKARSGRLVPLDITFGAAAEEYLASHKARTAESSHETVEKHFRLHLIPAFGTRRLDTLRPSDVIRWAERCEAAPASVNLWTTYIVAAVRHAVALGWVDRDPLPRGSIPSLRVSKAPPMYLTSKEWRSFLAAADEDHPELVDVFRALVLTAARAGELLSLTWGQVDLERGAVTFGMSKLRGTPKTLPLPAELRAILDAQPKGTPGALVFPGPKGAAWEVKTVSRRFKAIAGRAGLRPALHLHSLRHSAASWAVQGGAPIAEVSKALGHSSLSQTMVYAHLEPSHLTRTLEAVENVEKSGRAPLGRHRGNAK